MKFPADFVWGAATAAFQIEGSTTMDGRSDSVWDAFCRVDGAVRGGDTGDPGADHYRLMADDVALMASMGLQAYRFSVAWPRVRPDGGAVNQAGLDFYNRLVDTLLDNGITPWLTLYHWDLPQKLEELGGWTNRDTASRFADFTSSVTGRLGDKVTNWITLNEPWCASFLSYAAGIHAPGRTDPAAAVAAAHHLLLAHGYSMAAIREIPNVHAGITLNLFPVKANDPDNPWDADAARRIDGLQNRIFLEPVLEGRYPEDVVTDLEPHMTGLVRPGDLEAISAPIDFMGVNYYRDYVVAGGDKPEFPSPWVNAENVEFVVRDLPQTDSGWDINPDGLTDLLVSLHRTYPDLPLYVTENGAAFPDLTTDDQDRVSFLDSHLRAAHAAIEQGSDLRGYFCWSLLDNFEWAEGYAKRFGLVHVDFETQIRTLKSSAHWYCKVIRDNGLNDAE
ncbi:beta-glucosidase [Kibdelosporangium banguiense]|uniref:Beta-glucosidase n=1 Tax=Kibdelosporangium banguiense TaxID=1365924 RepID=A0ABS4TAS6_9PSEU|nr:GH1 family beta-glucosidase [Kibdelosporangium banguiense]MBP2321527.1 beta-glucosidase [Kibdelosporangium banguiense]